MDLECKRCGAPIAAADMNLDQMMAKCAACDALFPIATRGDDGQPKRRKAKRVAMPDGWELEEGSEAPFGGAGYRDNASGESTLRLRWKWFGMKHAFKLVFCVFWFGFLSYWYKSAASTGAPAIFFLFPLIHVAVGLWLFYSGLAGLLNTTTLDVRDGKLSVKHGPLPWRGNRTLAVDEIEQLFCTRKKHKGKNGTSYTFEVQLMQRGGRELKLIAGLPNMRQALFIERKVEEVLDIADEPIAGEHKA